MSIQEPSTGTAASEPRPPAKSSHGAQVIRSSQGSMPSSLDALGPTRKEEEAPFWKINAERSREGPKAEFQSLTPSQIKSMEKGEKVLPAGCRQEPAPKDREAKIVRQEQRVLPSVSVEPEKPQPIQAPTGTLPEVTPSESLGKPPSLDARQDGEDDSLFSEPTLAQVGGPHKDHFRQGASSRGNRVGTPQHGAPWASRCSSLSFFSLSPPQSFQGC